MNQPENGNRTSVVLLQLAVTALVMAILYRLVGSFGPGIAALMPADKLGWAGVASIAAIGLYFGGAYWLSTSDGESVPLSAHKLYAEFGKVVIPLLLAICGCCFFIQHLLNAARDNELLRLFFKQ